MSTPLEGLKFDNRFTRELPGDPETENFRRQVPGACFSNVLPAKVTKPKLLAYSPEMAQTLGLSPEFCESEEFTRIFSGNKQTSSMTPYAMNYGGHQFGNWAGQLGDGRAINLGEVLNQKGERWALQLKGAGPTPYSRNADGLAVLRSSLREFLCSESMFHLGVPTTRALSLIQSGEDVMRDMFYNGNAQMEPGAIVCRVAPSFTRFGNFEIFASRNEKEILEQLIKYTINTDFPHLGEVSNDVIMLWFQEVCRRTMDMIVHWMRVGFVHGVMNTDNMSILGLTIDYGPYGWLENYDPDWTPNTTDAGGRRYRFGQQGQIALWNLTRLAEAILPIVEQVEPLQESLAECWDNYQTEYRNMMAHKLGLAAFNSEKDKELLDVLPTMLGMVETDMTLFFRNLAEMDLGESAPEAFANQNDEALIQPLLKAYYAPNDLKDEHKNLTTAWLRSYSERLAEEKISHTERRKTMNAVNPKYVLRNYLAQLAIDDAEKGDYALLQELHEVLRHPYEDQPGKEKFAEKRPEWARNRAGCSMLSCSS